MKSNGVMRLCAALLLVMLAPGQAPAVMIALTGGTVHTLGPEGTLENATVLMDDGLIIAVGQDLELPMEARQIDVTGKIVTPGLLDSLSRIGVVEIGQVEQTRDFRTDDDRITAGFDVAPAINPLSTLIPITRVEGLTRALVAPGTGTSLIAGLAALIHLGERDLLVVSPVAMFAVLGESGASLAGGSRGAAIHRLREALQDARDYDTHQEAFLNGQRRAYALSRLDLEALGLVVRGELPLVVAVNRASDIQAALKLAAEEELRLILAGAAEGWMVAEEIAAAGVPVLLNPLTNRPSRFETLGATLENPARLHAAGVTIAFMSGTAHNSRNLKQAAGNAVAYGLPWLEALRAMTVQPARIWGVDERYGTLETGKEADVVVWDGDPLEVTTFADRVFIRGVPISMETRQTKLLERYRELGGETPPAYRKP